MKRLSRELSVNLLAGLACASILAIVPQSREWLALKLGQKLNIPIWVIGSLFIAGFSVGFAVSYLLQKGNLSRNRKDKRTDTLRGDFIDAYISRRIIASANNKDEFSLLLFDIDNFKRVNDEFTHEVGNRTLREVADILKPRGKNEEIFRYGGDEFLVLSDVGTGEVACWGFAKRLVKSVSENDFTGQVNNPNELKITVSCGAYIADQSSKLDTIKNGIADALKAAKNSGKNAIYVINGTANKSVDTTP